MERLKLLALVLPMGCFPTFEDRPWQVDVPRFIAIRADPAEVRPSQEVVLTALLASADEEPPAASQWSWCTQPRTVEERGAVSAECAMGNSLTPVPSVASIPDNACALFGPNPPPTTGDEPARRPADPDITGGYAMPVRVRTTVAGREVLAFAAVRLRCDLAGATRSVFDEYEARYIENLNPQIEQVEVLGPGVRSDGASFTVAANASVELWVSLAEGSAEGYVIYQQEQGRLVDASETLTARFFVTDGELEQSATSLEGLEATGAGIAWRAPSGPTRVDGWVVVSDERGGTDWRGFRVTVESGSDAAQ